MKFSFQINLTWTLRKSQIGAKFSLKTSELWFCLCRELMNIETICQRNYNNPAGKLTLYNHKKKRKSFTPKSPLINDCQKCTEIHHSVDPVSNSEGYPICSSLTAFPFRWSKMLSVDQCVHWIARAIGCTASNHRNASCCWDLENNFKKICF